MIPKSCRLFGQDHAPKQRDREHDRFNLKRSCSRVCWDSSRVYHGCGEMDHGGEALIGLVGAHCDTFEHLEPVEEVLDEMPPFVHLLVDGERLCAARMLGDD